MAETLPQTVTKDQPHSVGGCQYRDPVQEDLKLTIRANIRRLLHLTDGESGVAQVMKLGFSNGTAQSLLAGETSIGVDVLAKVAAALRVEPWQLCVPGLDPERMPSLEPQHFRWPFRQVDPDQLLGLVGTTAATVEVGLIALLAAAGAAAPVAPQRKRDGTGGLIGQVYRFHQRPARERVRIHTTPVGEVESIMRDWGLF